MFILLISSASLVYCVVGFDGINGLSLLECLQGQPRLYRDKGKLDGLQGGYRETEREKYIHNA